jgi:hypothetical protein
MCVPRLFRVAAKTKDGKIFSAIIMLQTIFVMNMKPFSLF